VKKSLYYKVRTDLSVNHLEILECCLKVLNEIYAETGACVLHTGVLRTSTELINLFLLIIHRSLQVPVSVVKFVASNTTFSKFNLSNIFFKIVAGV
jgi:hypothetical protein